MLKSVTKFISSNVNQQQFRLKVMARHLSQTPDVIFSEQNCKGVITLNRVKSLNALTLPMIRSIYPKLQSWNNDSNIKCIIINANGKHFCSGGDIIEVTKAGKTNDSLSERFFYEEYQLNNLIGNLKKPYISLLKGVTMGGGVGVSIHGKFRICNETCIFAMPETGIGLFPDVGGGYFLPRLEGELGTFLALTGYRLKGFDLLHAGIATHFIENKLTDEIFQKIINMSYTSEDDLRKLFNEYQNLSLGNIKMTDFTLKNYLTTINQVFSGNSVEEIIENLVSTNTEWTNSQLKTISKMSPTSLKITLKLLRLGRKLNLSDVLKMEYRLSQGCISGKDFYEGVRALLIDKDNTPVWNPKTLKDVTDSIVDSYFLPLTKDKELNFD